MSDTEFLCGWMEPKPRAANDYGITSIGGWWWWGTKRWEPVEIDSLDQCHAIEARLTDKQWTRYHDELWAVNGAKNPTWRYMLHVTPEQKVRALANTLDPERKVRAALSEKPCRTP